MVLFKGASLTVNYPEDTQEAALPSEMTLDQLCTALRELVRLEPSMTSFVLVAVRKNTNV